MGKQFFFLSFIGWMTVFCLIGMTGCGKTLFSGSGPDDDPGNSRNPQLPPNLVWYVSPTGHDSNPGDDPSKPLASVTAALARVKSIYRSGKWPSGESAVIRISGTITGFGSFGPNESMVDVSGAGNYPPIVLEGEPVWGGILNANRNENNQGRVLYIANNKVTLGDHLTLTGGYKLWGGGVCVGSSGSASEGEFIMAGGEISGNTAGLGGGVLIYKGLMTMSGGIIRGNTPTDSYSQVMGSGGGIFLNEYTSLTMTGGTIRENGGAKTDNGGGVLIEGHALFTLINGEILDNVSKSQGGGVHIAPYGTFTMAGGTISGNTSAAGGGVFRSPYNGVFTKTGGIVSGNTPD